MKTRARNYAVTAMFMVIGIVLTAWLVSWVIGSFDLSDVAAIVLASIGGVMVATCTAVLYFELEEARLRRERRLFREADARFQQWLHDNGGAR